MHFLSRIEQAAQAYPDRAAVTSDGRSLSYSELWQQSGVLAAWLSQASEAATPVAVVGHKQPELLVAFLAAARLGRPYVPIESSTPEARVARMVEIAGAAIVLSPERILELVQSGGPAPNGTQPPGPDTPLYVLFTSGSTGEPKGVVVTHGNLEHYLSWQRAHHEFSAGNEVFINHAPFTFDLSVHDIYLTLTTGGTLVTLTKDTVSNLGGLFRVLAASNATHWMSTPSFVRVCTTDPTFGAGMLPALRRIYFCGEALPPALASEMLRRFPDAEILNTYGPTEATIAVSAIQITASLVEQHAALPIGVPMPGSELLICDSEGTPLGAGERGEIVIVGPNVSPGYLARPELNAQAFRVIEGQRAYRTGDWGRFSEGLFFCEGRMDFQVKIHGHRIELGDVEANIRALPGVQEAAVIASPGADGSDALVAFVVAEKSGAQSDLQRGVALKQELAKRVSQYMIPRRILFLDALPMNTNGKTDRAALKRLLQP
jgi:D-alanine--poly(phosphoribitol) ligase subunit 1